MEARTCQIVLVLVAVSVMAVAASNNTGEPQGKEWAQQAQSKWLQDVQRVSLHFVVEYGQRSVCEQIEAELRLKAMNELKRCGIAILPGGMPEEQSILPVLRISMIMTRDPMRGRGYYYCAAVLEHIEPCSLFRTKEIGMANCWCSGPVLIGGQLKDIVQRIDLCVREYTRAIKQANSQA